jgi:hypothetical protein
MIKINKNHQYSHRYAELQTDMAIEIIIFIVRI